VYKFGLNIITAMLYWNIVESGIKHHNPNPGLSMPRNKDARMLKKKLIWDTHQPCQQLSLQQNWW
jgi:hypothetical protein